MYWSPCAQGSTQLGQAQLSEVKLVRLLAAFIAAGIFYMLVPGTIIGVWNLIQIGNLRDAGAARELWIQAHGHAQLFGWIGTFILGIGYYCVPNLRKISSNSFVEGWITWLLWVSGVGLRCYAAFTGSNWHLLYPLSATLEFAAVFVFIVLTMRGSRHSSGRGIEGWSLQLIYGSFLWLLLMLVNLLMLCQLAWHDQGPLIPEPIGKPILFAAVWGWVVPIVFGLSARWMPQLLGLSKSNDTLIKLAAMVNLSALIVYGMGIALLGEVLLLVSTLSFLCGLRIFGTTGDAIKSGFRHRFFSVSVRLAFAFLLCSSLFFVASALLPACTGLAGAARHAITVGFFAMMVFSVGPRLLPGFLGQRTVFSEGLVYLSLSLLFAGCILRVISEIFAYDLGVELAWLVLPNSAIMELSAIACFALNLCLTLFQKPVLSK